MLSVVNALYLLDSRLVIDRSSGIYAEVGGATLKIRRSCCGRINRFGVVRQSRRSARLVRSCLRSFPCSLVRIKSQRRHCSDRDPYERNTALRMPSLTTTIDDSSPIFQWLPSSSWYAALSGHDNSTSSYYMSTSTFSNSSNANVTFTFAGHSIQVYGRKTEKHGFYQVQIDDKVYPQIDGSGSPQGLRQLLFSEDGLGEGVHSVIMKNLDDTKLLAIDYVTWQSYIGKPDSKDELTVKTVQDTNPDIKYQGSWRTDPSNLGTFFGGTGHVSTEAGSSLQYSFTGGAIALFGPSGPRGASYSVQLDNEAPQNFSFYSPQDIPQSTLYFRGGLSTGKRTLKVTYTGSASDENGNLAIDYMNVFTTNTIESLASNRLSPSAIAAITVGTFAFILLFLLSLYYCLRQEKGWNDSEGIGRLFNLGWWNRMTKGKKMTPRGFDLDEGGDYGAAGVSEREGEYLISSLGSPGVSEAIRLGEVRNEVGVGMGMGNLSVHLNAFSDTSRSPSHLTGNIRHHMQQSSLSGLSVLNQPLVRTRSSVDVESSSVASNGNGSEGTQEQSEFSVPLPEYSASQGTLVPSATMIFPTSSHPLNQPSSVTPPLGAMNQRPLPTPSTTQSPSSNTRSESVLSYHPQSISEPGPPSQVIPQYQLVARVSTGALPLPPGAARPTAPTINETNEPGARTRTRATSGSVGSRGGGSGVVGPRMRSSISQRMSFSAGYDAALPEYRSQSGECSGAGLSPQRGVE